MKKGILLGHKVVEIEDLWEWAKQVEDSATRRVKQDEVDGFRVSTVFLGLDHSFMGSTPHWFETMIFGDNGTAFDDYQERYPTWEEAVIGHERAVNMVKNRDKKKVPDIIKK